MINCEGPVKLYCLKNTWLRIIYDTEIKVDHKNLSQSTVRITVSI